MINVLIGHRGVGKSSLLKRISTYFPNDPIFDLDFEIEKHLNRSIQDVFKIDGEKKFRTYEVQVFQSIFEKHKKGWVALGAGFNLDQLPAQVKKIWIRRVSDQWGRIFLDRPRLTSEVSPLNEFKILFQKRDHLYRKYADQQYWMPEGLLKPNQFEKQFLEENYQISSGFVTLKPENYFLLKFKDLAFEIRDDLIDEKEIPYILKKIDLTKAIFSSRKNKSIKNPDCNYWDWPCEWGKNSEASIISLHKREETIIQTINNLDKVTNSKQFSKLAIPIHSFEELQIGWQWQQENPSFRSFLPMSEDGKWVWFRMFMRRHQFINFYRFDEGTSLDQPTIYQWLSEPFTSSFFAAVLGTPIQHSYSPEFHRDLNRPFYGIDITSGEFLFAMKFLESLGLKCAAVTSPLKEKAFALAKDVSNHAKQFESVNTLSWSQDGWLGENTDYNGLADYVKQFQNQKISVWGGGGTLKMLKKLFPEAQFLSVRTQKDRFDQAAPRDCDVLIWAARHNDMVPCFKKPVKIVLDLNYREDSLAREFAINSKAEYISGLKMFLAQAEAQRAFWSSHVS
jgi:shikimate kinase